MKPSIGGDHDHLVQIIEDYAQHTSWRCGHPDRYPWEPDGCPCGLTEDLKAVGLPVEWAGDPVPL